MDLDNQNSTAANTNTDSATPVSGSSTDSTDKPTIDMDAINEAVAAENAKSPNLQTSFDVNDISLDNVPSSQAELDQQIKENPEMSLAGAGGDAAAPAEKKAAPAAAFVDGDIVDEEAAPAEETKAEAPKAEYDNINSDPLSNFETGASNSEVAKSLGDPAQPTEAPAATEGAAAEATPPPAGEPAHIANTITMPAQKSKKPIIIGVGIALVAVVIVALVILTGSK